MKILGLKLTHDGTICLIDNGKLMFSIELEKLNNNNRFKEIDDLSIIPEVLSMNGVSLSDVDHIVVDGWGCSNEELAFQPRMRAGEECNYLSIQDGSQFYEMVLGQYQESSLDGNMLDVVESNSLSIGGKKYFYSSYLHVTGHILSAYGTSPFAKKGEPSFVLVWDGAMFPSLYHVDPILNEIKAHGPLFSLIGNIYAIFSQHFQPFQVTGDFAKDNLTIAGKVMAYIAKGKFVDLLVPIFKEILNEGFDMPMGYANIFAIKFKKKLVELNLNITHVDILNTFHHFLESMLVEKLKKKIRSLDYETENLCIAGGCGLNIKWNSAIRESNIVKQVYVPPFPNDSGSAIGTALAKYVSLTSRYFLEWNVYSGPQIIKNSPYKGWELMHMSIPELAKFLYDNNKPVVVLNGRAELGPRALGNRSIIAPAVSPEMKDLLNIIKQRESYRPVSPICLFEKAKELFNPGLRDEFMLFDHNVRTEWLDRIPAIIHEDNTARLQTVSKSDNRFLYNLLVEYYNISGIPVLCNTSANFNGKGFFPDIYSATKWGGTDYVWSDATLYYKSDSLKSQIL
ncbi:MAG TPA: carbamoyltransferase N-terminal domain-containing protein [Pseudosphingobacterium sp.]|nr:carbamoyltransferase N-terminal domain-containing protein [Pseudosphingobacterium sp.]